MLGMARDPTWVCPEWHETLHGYARNGTGPYMGMPGMARDPIWVCPEWHGAFNGMPELNEMVETNEVYNN